MNESTHRLHGRIALITGASKGIGAGIAKDLAAAGAAVVVNYASSRNEAEALVQEIAAQGGRAVAVQADVSRPAEVKRLLAETKQAYGSLDILVNNAGMYRAGPLGQITEQHFHEQFDLNVLGLILVTQEALPLFGTDGGSIINISSIVSTLALPGTGVYNATKAAVDALTRTFARELAPRRIRVNSVNPGAVETEGLHSTGFFDGIGPIVSMTPLGRIGQPGDIGPVVRFLASPDSGWITGESLFVTGGLR